MKDIKPYLGIVIILLGVLFLAAIKWADKINNLFLITGWIVIVIGIVVYIVMAKRSLK